MYDDQEDFSLAMANAAYEYAFQTACSSVYILIYETKHAQWISACI